MEERRHYRGGLVWPVILIAAGVVFLLNNMGVVSWGVWGSLWRLWPVLLIAIGLDILIGRRSILGSLVVVLLLVAVLVWAIGFGIPQWNVGSAVGVDRTQTISEPLQGVQRADVEIDFGTGALQVTALPGGSGDLIKGTVDLSRDERLQLNNSGSGGQGHLILRSQNAWIAAPAAAGADTKVWDLEMNRDIPLNLTISTGVGRSTLDLSRLNLSGLEINGGVGQAAVTLPQQGRFRATLDGGVGDLTITLPQSMAARITVNGGLGGVTVDGNFNHSDHDYTTTNYATAEDRVDLTVDGGIGRVVIKQAVE